MSSSASAIDRLRRQQEDAARKLASERAEIVALWALGDLDGPAWGEVKIGICKRRSFYSDVLTRMKLYRSRQVIQRCVVFVRGEGAALRLKTAVFERLHEHGCGIDGPWFRAAQIVDGVVRECAVYQHVALLTEAQADAVEQAEFERIMDGAI